MAIFPLQAMNCRVPAQRDHAARAHAPHRLLYCIEASHLGAFTQVAGNDYVTFVASVLPSVLSSCISVAPTLDGFSSNLILASFCENMSRAPDLVQIG